MKVLILLTISLSLLIQSVDEDQINSLNITPSDTGLMIFSQTITKYLMPMGMFLKKLKIKESC